MIICCWKNMQNLQGNGGIDREGNETLFLLSEHEVLPLIDVPPLRKFMDTSRTEGEIVFTLRWWSVTADGSASFKDISWQVENRKKNCFYFAMMICCRWWICVLQGHFTTGRERKEKLFLLCDDDLLPLMDLRPSRALRDRSKTEGATDYTSGWSYVSVMTCKSLK